MGIPFDHKENFLAGEDENLNVAKTNKQLSICRVSTICDWNIKNPATNKMSPSQYILLCLCNFVAY